MYKWACSVVQRTDHCHALFNPVPLGVVGGQLNSNDVVGGVARCGKSSCERQRERERAEVEIRAQAKSIHLVISNATVILSAFKSE